jgi:hypothetical protein
MRFQILVVVSMMTVFWDVTLCSLVEIDISEVVSASIFRAPPQYFVTIIILEHLSKISNKILHILLGRDRAGSC